MGERNPTQFGHPLAQARSAVSVVMRLLARNHRHEICAAKHSRYPSPLLQKWNSIGGNSSIALWASSGLPIACRMSILKHFAVE